MKIRIHHLFTPTYSSIVFSGLFFFCIYLSFYTMQNAQKWQLLQMRIHLLENKQGEHSSFKSNLEELNELLYSSDPGFIKKRVESLSFLETEKKRIEMMAHSDPSIDWKSKMAFIDQNKLHFQETKFGNKTSFRETLLEQDAPIAVNEEDLKKILCLMEGTTIFPYASIPGRPQLIMKELSLEKKSLAPYQNIYQLKMKLLKREKNSNEKKPLPTK